MDHDRYDSGVCSYRSSTWRSGILPAVAGVRKILSSYIEENVAAFYFVTESRIPKIYAKTQVS